MDKLEHYLDQVCRSVGGPRSLRQHIRQELREHLLDAAAEYRAAGLSEEEAMEKALADFGGPDEVRSELEATHGHRLLPVVIDRAMQWKERTMRARWLWTTWATIAVVGVIVAEVFSVTFANMFFVPKLQKIQSEHWPSMDEAGREPVLARLDSFLHGLQWIGDHLTTWLLLGAAVLWGLFEWRVRSENKPFIRLSALGTVALVLAVVAMLVMGALVLPFLLGFPGMTKLVRPVVAEQVATIDSSVGAVEQSLAKKDWAAMPEPLDRAAKAVDRLSQTLSALPQRGGLSAVEELRRQLSWASDSLLEARQAIQAKDAGRLEAALKKFHESYNSVRAAVRLETQLQKSHDAFGSMRPAATKPLR